MERRDLIPHISSSANESQKAALGRPFRCAQSSERDRAGHRAAVCLSNVKRLFDPIAKDLKQYEHGKELVPGITAVDARGHSPGHTAFLVSSGNGKLLVTSDTVNHQVLVRNPEWALWADMDPAMAASARKRLLDMAAADKIQIAAYHLPFPSTGFISKQGNGYEYHPAYWQSVM